MKKLYEVKVVHVVYCLSEDEKTARQDAINGIADVADKPEIGVRVVKNMRGIQPEWIGAIPFGCGDDTTVAQWMAVKK